MNGLRGMPFSDSSCTSELKGVPEGSRPTRCQTDSPPVASASWRVKSLEMLWTEKARCQSPAPYTSPSTVARARPKEAGSASARAGM